MVNLAFNLGFFTIIFLIVGLIKPKWPLFFMEKPDRFMVAVITTIMIMIVMTLYGEGHRRNEMERAKQEQPAAATDTAPVPEQAPAAPAN